MQANNLEMINKSIIGGDDDDGEREAAPVDVCVRDKGAALRPLGGVENESDPPTATGYYSSSSSSSSSSTDGDLATTKDVSRSFSCSSSSSLSSLIPESYENNNNDDVKNSIQQNHRSREQSSTKVCIVDKEPDRASPASAAFTAAAAAATLTPTTAAASIVGLTRSEPAQIKYGNQTNKRESKGGIIIDPLGGQNGSTGANAVSLHTACYLDRGEYSDQLRHIAPATNHHETNQQEAKRVVEQIILLGASNINRVASETSDDTRFAESFRPKMGGADLASLTSGDEDADSETMTGSSAASAAGGGGRSAGAWSPSEDSTGGELQVQPNYEADTLRIIQSLNEQRRELQVMDRQLLGLIDSHLRLIGRHYGSEIWPQAADNLGATFNDSTKSLTDEEEEEDYRFSQVIDLTTATAAAAAAANSAGSTISGRQDRQQAIAAINENALPTQQHIELAPARSTQDCTEGKAAQNLGQFSSVNLRKSRLLSATIEMQQARANEIIADSPADLPGGSKKVILPKRTLSIALTETAIDNSPELTHGTQQLKRLRLSSGHSTSSSISSSGAFRDSTTTGTTNAQATTAANCNTIKSTVVESVTTKTPTTAENNIDLLRDFMLHNQYLPSHLVLECMSQCQKQTSTSSLSSILLPSAMSLIDASSPPASSSSSSGSSSTARNQTGGHYSALTSSIDRQINQFDMITNHHLNNRNQRGSTASYYPLAVLDGLASSDRHQSAPELELLQQQQQQHETARREAFMLATSGMNQRQQHNQFASHHSHLHNNHNGADNSYNNNQTSRPPISSAVADEYHLASPMTRHNTQQQQQQQQQLHGSQETLELIRANINRSQQQQQQQQYHHHHHLISMADIQRVAFKCHVCGSGFEDRHRLQQHLSIHLNLQPSWFEEKTITDTMAQYESKRGDYLCSNCDIRFETTAEFDKHMQAHSDKPHRCDLCSQDNKLVSFRYYRQLLTHLRSHCFLYSCRFAPDCKQTSNRKDYLKLHILKHHLNNQLPKQYTICCH